MFQTNGSIDALTAVAVWKKQNKDGTKSFGPSTDALNQAIKFLDTMTNDWEPCPVAFKKMRDELDGLGAPPEEYSRSDGDFYKIELSSGRVFAAQTVSGFRYWAATDKTNKE